MIIIYKRWISISYTSNKDNNIDILIIKIHLL